jgi:hypothetical protein
MHAMLACAEIGIGSSGMCQASVRRISQASRIIDSKGSEPADPHEASVVKQLNAESISQDHAGRFTSGMSSRTIWVDDSVHILKKDTY